MFKCLFSRKQKQQSKIRRNTDIDPKSIPASSELDEKRLIKRLGGSLFGLNKQIHDAKETIRLCDKGKEACFIAIIGMKKSGKTLLAKSVMQAFGDYTTIDMTRVSPDDFYDLLAESSWMILEGADSITDKELLDRLNLVLNESINEIDLTDGRKIDISSLHMIITLDKERIDGILSLNLNKARKIIIDYSRQDFVELYLKICDCVGFSMDRNSIHIDNRVLFFVGKILLRENIERFIRFIIRMLIKNQRESGMDIKMDNLYEFIPELIDINDLIINEET